MTRHSGKIKQYLCKTSIAQPKRLLTKYNLECNIRNYGEKNGIKYIIDETLCCCNYNCEGYIPLTILRNIWRNER